MTSTRSKKAKEVTQSADLAAPTTDAQSVRSDRMFDPYLASSHPSVKAITDNLAFAFEHLLTERKRKMKARDRELLHTMLRAVLANLVKAAVEGVNPPTIGVSLRAARQAQTRYDRPAFSGLPNLLEKLSDARIGVSLQRSTKKGIASTITLEGGLKETFARFRFRPEDFAQVGGRETVRLSRSERDHVADIVDRELIPYADTPETERYRAEVVTINAALRNAEISFEPDGGPVVLTSIRELRRCFNLPPDAPEGTERFDLGGRLFGGWWENLIRERRHRIRIEGEPIADLDFKAMFVHLAYLEAGLTPPPDAAADLYAVPGFTEGRHREGIKKTLLAMLFRSSPLARLPKDAKGLLPPKTTGSQVRKTIHAAHPALASILETGVGLRLMFLESQILVAALLRLADQRIAALPMHDGIMCPRSKADLVKLAMEDAAEQIVGFRLPVARKN